MSCSKPGLNSAGRSLYGAYGATHTRFHDLLKEVDTELRARGKNPHAPASAALTGAQIDRMRVTADQAARHGDTTRQQQVTITRHLDTAGDALAAGQQPKVREVVALRRLHTAYAPIPDAQARLEVATARAAAARVAAGQLALRTARGQLVHPDTTARVTQERRAALAELAAATHSAGGTAPTPPPSSPGETQRCPQCGEFVSAQGHHCAPGGEHPVAAVRVAPSANYADLRGPERVTAMTSDLESAVRQIVESGQLKAWMDTMASNGLTRWSANNRMLAALQLIERGRLNPDDWHLMSFNGWKQLGRHPKKGAKAVWILKPATRTLTVTDDTTGEQDRRRVVVGFVPHAVFDVADTEGRPLDVPQIAHPDAQVEPGTLAGLKERVAQAGYTYDEAPISTGDPTRGQGTLGYTTPEGHRIVVDSRLQDTAKASVLAHELGHVHCGHIEHIVEYHQHRGRMETEAEMVAYLVSRSRGMSVDDVNAFSPAYIATWSKGDMGTVHDAMTRACAAHTTIMDGPWPDHD